LVTFYGGAGSLVLVLLWAYYASQIFLFGASFIAVYASQYGSHVRPTEGAVAVHSPSKGESEEDSD
jgi:membrane protein